MKRGRDWFFAGLACALAFATRPARAQQPTTLDLPAGVWAIDRDDDAVDYLVTGRSGPSRIRMHVDFDGRSYRAAHNDFAADLFAYLDRGRKGYLTAGEADPDFWFPIAQSDFNGMGPNRAKLKGGKVGLAAFREFVLEHFPSNMVDAGLQPDRRADVIVEQLDTDRDGALSSDELAAATKLIDACDENGDEVVSVGELIGRVSNRNFYVNRNLNLAQQFDVKSEVFQVESTSNARSLIASLLLRRYDRGGSPGSVRDDGVLTRGECAIAAGDFDRVDANRDGKLDFDELKRLAENLTPVAEFLYDSTSPKRENRDGAQNFGAASARFRAVDAHGREVPPPDCVRFVNPDNQVSGNSAMVDVDGVEVEFATSPSFLADFASFLKEQYFTSADANGDKVLSRTEAQGSFPFSQWYRQMDHDGDGKITLKECEEFAILKDNGSRSYVRSVLSPRGPRLFETIDADDGRTLGVRELRAAADNLIPKCDRNHDGRITIAELPRRYLIEISRGRPGGGIFGIQQVDDTTPRGQVSTDLAGRPKWFQKMDLNNDSVLSPREFLGDHDTFAAYDTNGDGLITPAEAIKP